MVKGSSRGGEALALLGSELSMHPANSKGARVPMLCVLRRITQVGARNRYRPYHDTARAQIDRELALIEKLELAGYFLIVWDLVNFCRQQGILVQGRGSAANSAVCYSLGITAVDPVGMDLLFERFLSEERGEWPDIDLDLPSGEPREEIIRKVYADHAPRGAAMTANVITYRSRSALRDMAKACGLSLIWADATKYLEGALIRAAARRGKPAVLVEVGLGSLREPDPLAVAGDEQDLVLAQAVEPAGGVHGQLEFGDGRFVVGQLVAQRQAVELFQQRNELGDKRPGHEEHQRDVSDGPHQRLNRSAEFRLGHGNHERE